MFAQKRRAMEGWTDKVEKLLLPKYVFTDITVFMQTESGIYLNLSDFIVHGKENEKIHLNSNSQYVIMLCSFFYICIAQKEGVQPYICDITFDELLELAGIHDKSFLKRFKGSYGDTNEDLLAILCAKKIMDYRWGKVIKSDGNAYCFYRQGYHRVNGKNRRHNSLVFKKTFYKA